MWLQLDEDASLMAGLSLGEIASQIQMSTTGITGGSLLEQTESLPVRVKLGAGVGEQQSSCHR